MKHFFLLLVFVSTTVFAEASFGEIADNLFGPVQLVTQVMLGLSYAAGVALTIFGFLQYKAHRRNPKMVPITMPLVLIISGLILLALPKVTTRPGLSWAATVQSKTGVAGGNLSAPLHYDTAAEPSANVAPQQPAVREGQVAPEPSLPAPTPSQPNVYTDPDEPIK